MSVEMVFDPETDDETSFALATNTGWQDVCRWVAGLPAADYPTLAAFCRDGFATGLDRLRDELMAAVSDEEPGDDVADTAGVLSQLLDGVEDEAVISVEQ